MRFRTFLFIGLAIVAAIAAIGGITLSRLDLNTYFKDSIIDKVAQATGRKLVIGGEVRLTLLPAPALTVTDVAFANPAWAASPQMMTVGELSAQVALLPLLFGGKLHVDRFVLKDVDLRLATDSDGRSNWRFTAPDRPGAPPPAASARNGGGLEVPGFDDILLRDISIRYDDGRTHETRMVSLTDLSITGSPTGPIAVTASAIYQTLPIKLHATLGALSSLMVPGQPYMIDANIDAAGATIKLIGSVAEPLTGRGLAFTVALDGHDLGPVGTLFGFAVPEKPYSFAATLRGDAGGTMTLTALQAAIGASTLSGKATVALASPRPKLSATLAAAMIDLTEWPKTTTAKRSGGGERVFGNEPLPLSTLRIADADITLTVAVMKSATVTLQDLSLHLTLDDRNLRIKPFAVTLDGGHMEGSADLSTRQAPAVLDIHMDAKHLDLGKLLAQMAGNNLLEGKGDLSVAAHGSGDSVHAIMTTLDGTSSLVIGRGLIKNRYADLVGADVFREAFAWAQGKQDSKLTCMVSRFDIRKGLATSRDLLIDTSDVTIVGEGTVNLGSEGLDLELTPRPKEASLLSLATPIDIGGTFRQPTFQPNRTAMAKDVAKGVAVWINPLFALLPMVLDSGDDKTPCVAAIEMRQGSTDTARHKAAPRQDDGGIGGAVKGFGRSVRDIFR